MANDPDNPFSCCEFEQDTSRTGQMSSGPRHSSKHRCRCFWTSKKYIYLVGHLFFWFQEPYSSINWLQKRSHKGFHGNPTCSIQLLNPRGVRPGSRRLWRTTRLRTGQGSTPRGPLQSLSPFWGDIRPQMSQTSWFIGFIHFGAKLVEISILELKDDSDLYWEHQPQITMASPHKVVPSGDKVGL